MTMEFKNILLKIEANTALVTINRPDKLNALNMETIQELNHVFMHLKDQKEVKVIVLTGSGQKSFVAGADISEFANFSVEEGKKLSAEGHKKLFDFVENFSKPVIAAINGFALGGGLELAMSCHFRLASSNAKMGLPEVSLGVIPGYGGTQRLTQLVGKGKAMEMIMTADMISAEDALKWSLVNYVVPQEELLSKCFELAAKIASRSGVAIAEAIVSVNTGVLNPSEGFKQEIESFGKCFGTADFIEGTTAFLEKRKANFPG